MKLIKHVKTIVPYTGTDPNTVTLRFTNHRYVRMYECMYV